MAYEQNAGGGLRRRWIRILPAVLVTYSLAYLERANYAMGAAAGLARTLHITQARSALLAAAFFFGYFVLQVPAARYARTKNAKGLIFFALISWGVLAGLTGVIRNFVLLLADRLLLGVAESVILPAILVFLTNWFTKEERSRANAWCILGNPLTLLWMSAVTGYLIEAVGWQMAFVIEGIPSILWAFGWVALVEDRPEQVKWMSRAETDELSEKLAREQVAIPPSPGLAAAIATQSVVLMSVAYFLWSLGVYGFVLWLPTIVLQGSSQGIGLTGLLSAVPYGVAALSMILVSHFADKTLQRKWLVVPFLFFAGASFFLSFATANRGFALPYVFLIVACAAMYVPYGPFFAIVPDLLPANVAGEAMAFINSCGALGAFAGSYFVGLLQAYTHGNRASFLAMSSFLALSAATMSFVSLNRGDVAAH